MITYGTVAVAGALGALSPPFELREETVTLIAVPTARSMKVASLSFTMTFFSSARSSRWRRSVARNAAG